MTLPAGPPLLEFRHVTILRGLKPALDDVSISIPAGEHVAILGPNGCGKSTFVKAITRECYPLARPGSSIRIFGREVWNVFDLRSHLGIVSNDLASIYARDISGTEAVLSGFFSSIGIWSNHQVTEEMLSKAADLLTHLEVSHLAERSMSEMSSGEARRILLCRALVHNPQALLLDEPSTSLDLHAQRELTSDLQRLARSGVTILLVTHSLADIIPEIQRVLLLKSGRIAADGTKDQILTSDRLSHLFNCSVDITQREGFYHAW